MALKKNTQKLLLALYEPGKNAQPVLTQSQLRPVVAELTESGYRSLLVFLEKKKLLYSQRLFSQLSFGLTEQGGAEVEALFPALSPKWQDWRGEWSVLTFLEAPSGDSHFRYLRSLLIKQHALPISRGVFVMPGEFSESVLAICRQLYPDSVLICSVADWILGLDNPRIISYYDLLPLAESYSSISNQASSLLTTIDTKNRSINQSNLSIPTMYDRFVSSLSSDPGILAAYVPGVPGAPQLQHQLRKVLLL